MKLIRHMNTEDVLWQKLLKCFKNNLNSNEHTRLTPETPEGKFPPSYWTEIWQDWTG